MTTWPCAFPADGAACRTSSWNRPRGIYPRDRSVRTTDRLPIYCVWSTIEADSDQWRRCSGRDRRTLSIITPVRSHSTSWNCWMRYCDKTARCETCGRRGWLGGGCTGLATGGWNVDAWTLLSKLWEACIVTRWERWWWGECGRIGAIDLWAQSMGDVFGRTVETE